MHTPFFFDPKYIFFTFAPINQVMEIISTKLILNARIKDAKAEGKIVGLVPTMGALHEGHISLVENAKHISNFIVVSIFVNPTQFNNIEDLKKYPQTLESDLALLEVAGADVVFTPNTEEMYPEEDKRVFDFGNLDTVMEGAFRPGHFNGVGLIISKLFDISMPDKAFFGEKDFQQLAIIKHLVKNHGYQIDIVPCAIVREADGLAMSSRNTRLTEEHRKTAPHIYKTLIESVSLRKNLSVQAAKKSVIEKINNEPLLTVEYFDIVDATTLKSITHWNESDEILGCIAVFAGDIRLIDNIRY